LPTIPPEPHVNDLFIQWAGSKEVLLALVFTKIDKLKRNELQSMKVMKTLINGKNYLPGTYRIEKEGLTNSCTYQDGMKTANNQF
jgi:GTP-binding protein EngB required for normal cell division